jgi:hypothetical protein
VNPCMDIDQVVRGTIADHPSWRRRLPLTVDALFVDARVRALAAALNAERSLGAPR